MLVSPVSVANVRTPGMNRSSKLSFGSETAQGGSVTPDPVTRVLEAEKDAFAERVAKEHKVNKKVVLIVLSALLTAGIAFSAATGYIQNLFGSGSANVPPNPPGIVEEVPGHTDDNPGFIIPSEKPTEKPGATETPGVTDPSTTTPGVTNNGPVVLLPDPENISEEFLTNYINRGLTINALGGSTVVDNMIDETYEKYGKYLNENISKNCVKVGLFVIMSLSDDTTEITPEALKKVNDFLKADGEEPLGTADPKQRIAALWIAASLYYDPGYNDNDDMQAWLEKYPGHRFDIANAFALAKYSDMDDVASYEDVYACNYANLFNIP